MIKSISQKTIIPLIINRHVNFVCSIKLLLQKQIFKKSFHQKSHLIRRAFQKTLSINRLITVLLVNQ